MKVRIASAGTGKTTLLVRRYLEWIAEGVPARRIAAVTFTRTGAEELRARVGAAVRELLDDGAFLGGLLELDEADRPRFEEALRELDGATLTTIHGFMAAALRLAAPAVTLDADFAVLGEWEARARFDAEVVSLLLLAADDSHPLHDAVGRLEPRAAELMRALFAQRSLASDLHAAPGDTAADVLLRTFAVAYDRYLQRLGSGLLAPAEIERKVLELLAVPAARERVAARYPVVLVDEFQDVNPLQGRFFDRLLESGSSVEVVGDPKQSIYGFRHADVEVFRRAMKGGDVQEPLVETRRHALVVARFLNALTATLAGQALGFVPDEAPPVTTAGPQAETRGRVEIHWVTGDGHLEDLRRTEARVLAGRLRGLRADAGFAFDEMAVVARSYASLEHVREALDEDGVPHVLLHGRGYYARQEIRDLVHALRVGVGARGASLAAWLRSPFAQLPIPEVEAVMRARDSLAHLEGAHPEVGSRLRAVAEAAARPPLDALARLVREPLIGGRRYTDFLDRRARDNVDALLFAVARDEPRDIAALLERLALLERQAEAGDVPQEGRGVKLLTVHRSKGLEWPVVAVFDIGRGRYQPDDALYVQPSTGEVAVKGGPTYADALAHARRRDEQEHYRLLYVAASRPREALLLTGSVRDGRYAGWAGVLERMGLDAGADAHDRPDFVLARHAVAPAERPARRARAGPDTPVRAEWTAAAFAAPPPLLRSPSELVRHERTRAAGSGGVDHGRASAIGTLVHFAISRDWSPDDPSHLANLRAQEVMFPFDERERDEILADVSTLLADYHDLMGTAIPPVRQREVDHAEIPFALPLGDTVWQGVIDRLYRVGGRWWIDDYKTDRHADPTLYLAQLAVYRRAAAAFVGTAPTARLVYLRTGQVHAPDPAELEASLEGA